MCTSVGVCGVVTVFVLFLTCLDYSWGETVFSSSISDNCVDPCVHTQCLNNGTCFATISCKALCACAVGYTGDTCQIEAQTVQSEAGSGMRMPDSTCNGVGLFCEHGHCSILDDAEFRCVCEDDWSGAHCNVSRNNSTLASLVGEKAFSKNSAPKTISTFALPNELNISMPIPSKTTSNNAPKLAFLLQGWGSLQSVKKDQTTTTTSTTILPGDLEQQTLDPRFNACSDTSIERSMSERSCDMQMAHACQYGVCQKFGSKMYTWGVGSAFSCVCDIGARGGHCEEKCCLNCGVNGRCNIYEEGGGVPVCDCTPKYTGDICDIFIPDPVSIVERENEWYLWVVGVCVGAFILLLTTAIIAPYMMWKHRVILVMKIVHYFQPYEDDDEKQWDAFVSFKSHPTDEHFVVHELYPKLEKELGFKLCLHFRDFLPGETISNNIIKAVEGSRRTILVLTPRYIESEFTRFEYQKAQEEMLKRKHRIIPIVLEDISNVGSDMDENLKGIIKSVTYLQWPGCTMEDSAASSSMDSVSKTKREDKFWKRLQLSLPKKKVSEGTGSCISDSNASSFSNSTCVSSVRSTTVSISSSSSLIKKAPLSCSISDTIPENKHQNMHGNNLHSSINNKVLSSQFDNVFYDDEDEDVYAEIDETLIETIKPLTEEEEDALAITNTGEEYPYDYAEPSEENMGDTHTRTNYNCKKIPNSRDQHHTSRANTELDNTISICNNGLDKTGVVNKNNAISGSSNMYVTNPSVSIAKDSGKVRDSNADQDTGYLNHNINIDTNTANRINNSSGKEFIESQNEKNNKVLESIESGERVKDDISENGRTLDDGDTVGVNMKHVEEEVRYIEFRTDGQNGDFMDIINPGYMEFQI